MEYVSFIARESYSLVLYKNELPDTSKNIKRK